MPQQQWGTYSELRPIRVPPYWSSATTRPVCAPTQIGLFAWLRGIWNKPVTMSRAHLLRLETHEKERMGRHRLVHDVQPDGLVRTVRTGEGVEHAGEQDMRIRVPVREQGDERSRAAGSGFDHRNTPAIGERTVHGVPNPSGLLRHDAASDSPRGDLDVCAKRRVFGNVSPKRR